MEEPGTSIVSRFWDEVFNRGHLPALAWLVAPAYALHDLSAPKEHQGRDALRDLLLALGPLQARASIDEHLVAEGGRVVTRLRLRAPRPAPTAGGTHLELSAISISRLAEGQLQESWLVWDAARAEQELRPANAEDLWPFWPPWR